MLAAGRLRHWIEIQEQTTVQDSHGDTQPAWNTFARCWAAIEPLSTREFLTASTIESEVVARIVIRYRAGIRASMRVLHRGRIYNIQGVLADKDSGVEYLTLPCSEGINEG